MLSAHLRLQSHLKSGKFDDDSCVNMSSTTFGPPFDYDDADIILRSSDHVDFHVHKVILSTSSPFFKSMFSLPQRATSITEKQNPVIDLTENQRTLATLLTLIYPVLSMVIIEPESLDDILDAFAAANKYDIALASHSLKQTFAKSKVLQADPIVAFGAAYSRELGEATRIAAKASLKHRMSLDSVADKLQYINGSTFYQLYKFHRACSNTASQAVSSRYFPWITKSDGTWWDLARIGGCSSKCTSEYYKLGLPEPPTTPQSSLQSWTASAPYHCFITRAYNVLLERPCREAVTSFDFLDNFYKQNVCDRCRLTLLGLPDFSRLLREEVERRVSEVRHYRFLQHITQRSLPKVHLELPF